MWEYVVIFTVYGKGQNGFIRSTVRDNDFLTLIPISTCNLWFFCMNLDFSKWSFSLTNQQHNSDGDVYVDSNFVWIRIFFLSSQQLHNNPSKILIYAKENWSFTWVEVVFRILISVNNITDSSKFIIYKWRRKHRCMMDRMMVRWRWIERNWIISIA